MQEARATSLMRSSINQFRNATALPSSSHTRHRRRGYATESTSLPRSILLRSPAPPSPTTQAQHPESASESASDIETYLHEFHRHIRRDDSLSKECASIPQLYKQLGNHAARVLNDELAFEDTPSDSRRLSTSNRVDKWQDSCELASRRISGRLVQEAEEDGLVLVSHVIASDPPITSWSLGFVIRTLQETTYIVTCSHTLESVSHASRRHQARMLTGIYQAAHSQRSIGSADSSTICITRSGLILPINGIASALPLHDLVVYTVSDLAMPRRQESDNAASSASSQLRSVPVALHPPQVGDKQQLFLIGNEEWRSCRVVGYKDPRGNDVEVS